MRNKEKLHEWIDRYNNSDLSGEELVIFLEMMNKDHRVREEVWLDNELNYVLKENDILELRKKIREICSGYPAKKTRNTMIMLMAASLLILLSAEYSIFYLTRFPNKIANPEFVHLQNPPLKKESDNLKTNLQDSKQVLAIFLKDKPVPLENDSREIKNTFDLLACYQPNKALETLIGTTNRSERFRMMKPEISSVFTRKSTIWFSWKTENPEETSLIVENNFGLIVYESDSNYNQSVFLKTSFLGFGLFYYKIIQKDEVIYFGKFTIQ